MFRSIAKQLRRPSGFWGRIISRKMTKGNLPVYEKLIKYMDIKPDDKMLEIGFGRGLGIELIMNENNSCRIYGIDFSELMFDKASERNKELISAGKVKLQFGDFLETDIEERDFDKIYFTNVVYFWENLEKPFAKLSSLVRNNGTVFFYMAGKDFLEKKKVTNLEIFNKYTIEQITEKLKSAGFREVGHTFDKGYFIKAVK